MQTTETMERELTLHQAKMNLVKYYAQKVDEEMDRLWEDGTINEQVIKQWGKEHMRKKLV